MVIYTMETEVTPDNIKVHEKIEKILQRILEPNFIVNKNDAHLNVLLIRLFGKDESGKPLPKLVNKQLSDIFCQWIIDASALWEKGLVYPSNSILCFALKLTSQLSSDEHIFVNLNSKNVFESLVGVVQRNPTKEPSVTQTMITLLCSFLEHKSGVQWVMATTHWSDVMNLGLTFHAVFVRKKAYQFITKLLEKTISFNQNFAVDLVAMLLKPLNDVLRSLPASKNGQNHQITNARLFQILKPTLQFISDVTTTLLKSFTASVLYLFVEQRAPESIETFLVFAQDEEFAFELLQIQFVFLFYKLCVKLQSVKTIGCDPASLHDISAMFDLIKNEMDKDNVRCVIRICYFAHNLYCTLAPRMPLCIRKGEVIEFQNQMIIFQLLPVLVISIQIMCGNKDHHKVLINDDFRRNFIHKLLKKAAIRSIGLAYTWKKRLQTKLDLMEDATFSLKYLTKTKNLLNKERAAIIFPALVYVLKDSLSIITSMDNIDWTQRHTQFVASLVDTMVDFVESFDLTWNDSIETISVMDLACDFLNYSQWTETIIIIKGLKLLNTAIAKYMCPDMVLLVYSTKDSTVSQTGSLLYDKCHESCWEIRDSALEVVHTLALNANTKFPALANVILDAKLPQLVANMAQKDGEHYVRATALRCLQEFVQIQEVRDELLGVDKFLARILNVLENETEGIIRKEAAVLVNKLYHNEEFPDQMLPRLYDVMTHAVIGDSYWEVKYQALDFWFETWRILLTNQGMIDLDFPSHTFSKEHKKIVALNEAEVRKRIIKVLNQLSNAGSLYVLKCAVLDDRDIEVSKRAMKCIDRVRKLFIKYKIPYENVDLAELPTTLQNDSYLLIEPVSPASSTTMTAMSPADVGNIGSPEFDDQYFDPFPIPFTPSLDLNHITPTDCTPSQNSSCQGVQYPSPSTQNSSDSSAHQQEVPGRTKASPNTEQDFYNIAPNENVQSTNSISNMFDVDLLGCGNENVIDTRLQDVSLNKFDQLKRDKMLEEFLNSNDLTLLPGGYSPAAQVTKKTTQKKKKTYLAPSEFVEFVYRESEAYAAEQAKRHTALNEFDSLLDDILKEYNIGANVSSMDCCF